MIITRNRTNFCLLLAGVLLVGLVLGGCASDQRRGDDFAERGQWDDAVESYRKATHKDPFDEDLRAQFRYAKARAAEQHYAVGMQALNAGHIEQALQEFKWSVGLDPSRAEHHSGLADAFRLKEARVQLVTARSLQSLGRLDDALSAYERAVELDPGLSPALEGITQVTVHRQAAKTFVPSTQPITLRFQQAKLREVFEVLARTAGVNVVFDKDVRDDPITIFLHDMPYDEALNLILNTNNLLAHKIQPDTLLVVPNTKQKHAQYEDLMIRTFYLSNTKAKSAVNLIRSMLESKRVYVDEDVNAIVVRDIPEKLHLAERIIHSIDRRQPEVLLELEVLEVNRTKSLDYGVNFAKTAGAAIIPGGATSDSTVTGGAAAFTFEQITSIGTGSYLFTIPASILLDFFKAESDAKTLAEPKIRVVNNKSASIRVGDQQPILLSTTNVLPGQAATGAVPTTSTVTSIEYKDTGVKLTVEPTIHLGGELTLKIKVEVTRLGDEVTLQTDPEIKQFRFGTRTAETILRLRDDETVILGGLLQDDRRKTRVTVPWFGDIPYLGHLFSSVSEDTISTEVVLAITPRIVRELETPGPRGQAFWSGTETNFSTDQLFSPSLTSYASGGAAPLPHQAAPSVDRPGLVPVQPSMPGPGPASQVPDPSPQTGPMLQGALPGAPPAPGRPAPTLQGSVPEVPQPQVATPVPSPTLQGKGETEGPVAASIPRVLGIRPSQVYSAVGQELRVDLTAQQLGGLTESVVTVSYNPTLLEFLRAGPGDLLTGQAGVSVKQGKGQVLLHIRRQSASGAGDGALATLFFRAKGTGTSPVIIQPALVREAGRQSVGVSVQPGSVVVR